jgi:hypothetical protein
VWNKGLINNTEGKQNKRNIEESSKNGQFGIPPF